MLRTRYSGHWRGREAPGRAAVARTLTVLERCLGAEMSHHLRHGARAVHEFLDVAGRRVRRSNIVLEHDTARSAGEYWRKLQRYARLWADEQRLRGRRVRHGRGELAAAAYLLKNLALRGGLIDGPRGWRFHWLHARYAKLKYDLLVASS